MGGAGEGRGVKGRRRRRRGGREEGTALGGVKVGLGRPHRFRRREMKPVSVRSDIWGLLWLEAEHTMEGTSGRGEQHVQWNDL